MRINDYVVLQKKDQLVAAISREHEDKVENYEGLLGEVNTNSPLILHNDIQIGDKFHVSKVLLNLTFALE